LVANVRQLVAVVSRIYKRREGQLLLVVYTGDTERGSFAPRQRWQKQSCKNGDDCYDDKQFNQREPSITISGRDHILSACSTI
jgi:hypothetical protein